MTPTRAIGMGLGAAALGIGLLATVYAQARSATQDRDYSSSVQVKDQDRDEHRGHSEERDEATELAGLATIDARQASSAAADEVPGLVSSAVLENENGNVVYSVTIKTASGEVKDVKVDAGTGKVLHVGVAGHEDEDGEEGDG